MYKPKKIIIDTDIGDDIDDALAIAFALESPEIEVVGITTVYKNTNLRAKLSKYLLNIANKSEICVCAGSANPINSIENQTEIPCYYKPEMDNIDYNTSLCGVDYIIEKLEESDDKITLVALGPLTNIAQALIKKPEIKSKIEEIVIMGGAFYLHFNEYNILCDPEAADIVFNSGFKIRAIGLDVTLKCVLNHEHMNYLKLIMENSKNEYHKFLADIIFIWHKDRRKLPILHDPLAICAVFDNALIEYKDECIMVETKGELTRGTTFNATGTEIFEHIYCGRRNAIVANKVNSEGFVRLFISRVFNEM
jgi:purine nucleosidase